MLYKCFVFAGKASFISCRDHSVVCGSGKTVHAAMFCDFGVLNTPYTERCVGCPQETQIAGVSETSGNSPHRCLHPPLPLHEMLTHIAPAD